MCHVCHEIEVGNPHLIVIYDTRPVKTAKHTAKGVMNKFNIYAV